MQRLDSQLSSGTASESEAKQVRSILSEVKTTSEARTAELQACQASEAEASGQLRNERAKLADLQERIERLDKTLESQSAGGK
jgi:chromosome segregation ATPase